MPALAVDELDELPVNVDWFAHRKGMRLTREELGATLATEARRAIGQLLRVLAAEPRVRLLRMAELVEVTA